MQLIRHLPCRLNDERKSALAIGNFDGLHRGHLALIDRISKRAPELAPALLYFEPLPRTFFQPDRPVPRLMTLRDRLEVSGQHGIQRMFQLTFNRAFATQSPEQFIDDVVLGGANAGHVVVGQDFRFGNKAAGDVDDLRRFGQLKGFSLDVVEPVLDEQAADAGLKVSSTGLRQALASGDFDLAKQLLGRPYRISGRVLRGQQLGRTLGFATINLRVPEPPALAGIFAVRVQLQQGSPDTWVWPGVASLGKRPTVAGRDWLLEVHLIDFEGDLYHQHVSVDFIAKRRDEAHFSDLDSMKAEMRKDLAWARQF